MKNEEITLKNTKVEILDIPFYMNIQKERVVLHG